MLLLLACAPPPAATLEPASGSMFGYEPVVVDLSGSGLDPAAVTGVRLGDVPAIQLEPLDDTRLQVTVQGSPVSGPALLEVEAGAFRLSVPDAYTFDPPVDPVFERLVAFGASLGQGVQGGVPTDHGALHSPSARIAAQAGAHHPLPLLLPGLFPSIEAGDVGPPPACETPDVVGHVANAAVEVLGKLNHPVTGDFGYYLGRQSPDLEPWDVAVGGLGIVDNLREMDDDFSLQFVAHMVLDPYGSLYEPVPYAPIELVEALEPTLVMSCDLYGNDLIAPLVDAREIDPELLTDEATFHEVLVEGLDRLEATGAEVFLANLPQPSTLPITQDKRSLMISEGWAAEDVDALVAEVDAVAARFDELLAEEAAARPTVHVVDLHGEVERIKQEGLVVGDEVLTVERFHGLLSTDGVHFSDTGYAMVAQLFADAIEAELGVALPAIDLVETLRGDPFSPAALAAGGVQVDACE